MKTLIAATLLLALTLPAHADDAMTCIGRVKIDVVTSDEGLYAKGDKLLTVGGCVVAVPLAPTKQILRICPMGSDCRIVGSSEGDGELHAVDSIMPVRRTSEYQEGVRHYREGLCFRARPYIDGPEEKLWERGYDAYQTKKQTRRNDKHCHPKY